MDSLLSESQSLIINVDVLFFHSATLLACTLKYRVTPCIKISNKILKYHALNSSQNSILNKPISVTKRPQIVLHEILIMLAAHQSVLTFLDRSAWKLDPNPSRSPHIHQISMQMAKFRFHLVCHNARHNFSFRFLRNCVSMSNTNKVLGTCVHVTVVLVHDHGLIWLNCWILCRKISICVIEHI